MEPELDFPFLDDILPVSPASAAAIASEVCAARPRLIGPLVEYAFQAKAHGKLPLLADLCDSLPLRELRRVASAGSFDRMPVNGSHDALDTEFHWAPPKPDDFSAPPWIMFLRRF